MSGECNEKSPQLDVCAADVLRSDVLWSSGCLGCIGGAFSVAVATWLHRFFEAEAFKWILSFPWHLRRFNCLFSEGHTGVGSSCFIQIRATTKQLNGLLKTTESKLEKGAGRVAGWFCTVIAVIYIGKSAMCR